MSKRKQPNSKFVLEEKGGVVVAYLEDENDLSFHHTITGMPHPRVRAPRQDRDKIEGLAEVVSSVLHYESTEVYLEKNISGMNQEINKQIHEVRKILRRIQSNVHYVITAQEVLDKRRKNT